MNGLQEAVARKVCVDKVRHWSMSDVDFRDNQFQPTPANLKEFPQVVQEAYKKDPTIKVFGVREDVVHDEYAVVSRRIPIPWKLLGI